MTREETFRNEFVEPSSDFVVFADDESSSSSSSRWQIREIG